MKPINLGTHPDADEPRDAIHVAVVPVVLLRSCKPGTHVGVTNPGYADPLAEKLHGVVDPYLKDELVKKGTRVWLLLYPNTVTGVRHEWKHPDFDVVPVDVMAASERRLHEIAELADVTYKSLLTGAEDYLDNDEYMCQGDKWEGFSLPDDFWDHYENVTGRRCPPEKRWSFFTCSC